MSVTEHKLQDYGIQTEISDYRAHVCFGEGFVYIYPTACGQEQCVPDKWPVKPGYQQGCKQATSQGYLVPPKAIRNCRRLPIPYDWPTKLGVSADASTTEKGQWAVEIVKGMLKRALLPLHIGSREIGDQRLQVAGVDLIIDSTIHIQVKCDYDGGVDGTGNLFLQIAECNPHKRH
jgi:hypothetical protein